MGFIQQIFCDSCSSIAPGAGARDAAEKTAKQYGWKRVGKKHQCPGCSARKKQTLNKEHQPELVAKLIIELY